MLMLWWLTKIFSPPVGALKKNIQAQIESERRNTISRNREIMKSVVKCVHFCGKQSIALRGHRDDSCADERSNKGNFLALLEVHIDAGDEPLKKS